MSKQIEWTDAQLLALRKRGNTLVSAAAGSGKTAVLTEKIMRLLTVSGRSLDEMLVVTYTKNAAEELKVRIGKKLTERAAEDPSAARHLGDLPRAVIGTIHSFLLKVVREYYSALGLPPAVSVIGEGDLKLIKAAASGEALDTLFSRSAGSLSENEMSIPEVCDVIGSDKNTENCIRSVYDELRCRGYGEEKLLEFADELEKWAERDFLASPWGAVLRDELETRSKRCREIIEELVPEMYSEEKQRKNVEYADRIIECLNILDGALCEREYDGVRRAASAFGSIGMQLANNKVNPFEPSVHFRQIRDEIKDVMFCKKNLVDEETVSETMRRTARFVRGFGRAVGTYGKIFEEKKRERGGVDYQDLESFALRLFVGEDGEPTAIARKIGERFPLIFVDEYQDANAVQDAIFRAIGGNSERFLVGDVKQAIYRFRGGEPEVFSGYREKWESVEPREGDGDVTEPRDAGVFMSTNFRCSKPVVDLSNAVSRRTFPYSRVPFREEDELIFGAESGANDPVTVCLIDEKGSGTTEEQYTAAAIRSMIGTDPFGSGSPLKPEDFAILVPKNDFSAGYADALEEAGIPSTLSLGVDLSKESEVILALDILRTVDNPYRDGPLAGTMFSSIGGFSLDDLGGIRRNYRGGPLWSAVLRAAEDDAAEEGIREKCAEFVSRIARYRSAEKSSPANVFVEYVFSETGIMNAPEVTEKISGADRLRTLLDFARKYEDGQSGGLFGFLSYVDSMIDANSFFYTPEKTGAVRIMTIHKAKGLEFPVCFMGKTAKEYNEKPLDNPFRFDCDLGIGSYLPGGGGYSKYDSVIRRMIVEKMRAEGREEQMRVLYVAMTRAKYKLFITAAGEPAKLIGKAREKEWRRDAVTVGEIKRHIDHILGAALAADPSVCEIVTVTEEGEINRSSPAEEENERAALTERAREAARRAKENFAFEYPFAFLSNLPSKLAVSKLYPEVLDEGEATVAPDEEVVIPDGAEMPYPTFMTGTTDFSPAEKGTANHVFIQFCDFDRLVGGSVAEEKERLVSLGFMTAKMADLVEEDFIDGFIRGGLFARMKNAGAVWREFRFNVRLPASEFTSDGALAEEYEKADARVTVQGVFDCVFREKDGTLVLVDYKTDAMTAYDRAHPDAFAEKLRERHKSQLSYYKEAAALIFGRAPDETLIWSLPMGAAVMIP